MITETFDNQSMAIINPEINDNAPVVDACIFTIPAPRKNSGRSVAATLKR